ncbi:MAG: SAM-dependent methyltransferase, partial [Bacteroidales bacterium]|nr:SAM-dependent methyltransferase [Bacteroidales bacterium]
QDTGLLSEAGTPCIADPGSAIVNLAHRQNIRVIPLVGPSSILLSLMASGFNGQNFCFHGYLPIKKHERENKLRELEKMAEAQNQTQVFIETPYRNMQMLESILKTCNKKTQLCIAANISLENELIKSMQVTEWKKAKVDLHKKPTVYLIYV